MAAAQFAPTDERNEALLNWFLVQQDHPDWYKKFEAAYGDPLIPWPGEKNKVEFFLSEFEKTFGKTSPEQLHTVMSEKKLEGFVNELDTHLAKNKTIQEDAIKNAKQQLESIKKQVSKNGGDPAKVLDPTEDLAFRQKIDEDIQKPIARVLSREIPVTEKTITFAKIAVESEAAIAATDLGIQLEKSNLVLAVFSDPSPKSPKISFKNIAVTSTQKAIAPILDAATTLFPELRRGAINYILIDSVQRAFDKIGRSFASNPLITKLLTDSQQAMMQGTQPSGAAAFVGSTFGSIFHGAPDETATAWFRLVTINATQGLPSQSLEQFRIANANAGPSLFSMGIGLGISKARNALIGGFLSKIGIAAGESTIPVVGWAAGLFTLASGLFNKAVGWLKGLTGGKPGEVPGDRWILGGIGCLVFIAIILPLLSQEIIDSALIGRLQSVGGGTAGGPTVNCAQTPNDPQCQFKTCTGNCQWPASGIITQGPFTGGYCTDPAQTSHDVGSAANGIDIANPSGGPIYTPRAGTIIEAYTQCADFSGKIGSTCGGSPAYAGYGNHVILKTDDGYILIFGHMRSAMNVTAGQHVDAGTQLGWMDQTGNSTGTHLHFGVLSGGSVLDFVPPGDPTLTPQTITGCVDDESSCRKTCPYTPVTTGG